MQHNVLLKLISFINNKLWNNLSSATKQNPSLSNLKRILQTKNTIPKYYYFGHRRVQILHTRLRLKCSTLKHHLSCRNIVKNLLCTCRKPETNEHYLLECPLITNARRLHLNTLLFHTDVNILLYGDTNLSSANNETIFKAVHKFISASKRFQT